MRKNADSGLIGTFSNDYNDVLCDELLMPVGAFFICVCVLLLMSFVFTVVLG